MANRINPGNSQAFFNPFRKEDEIRTNVDESEEDLVYLDADSPAFDEWLSICSSSSKPAAAPLSSFYAPVDSLLPPRVETIQKRVESTAHSSFELSDLYPRDGSSSNYSGKDEWADYSQPSANNNSQKLSDFYQSIGPLSPAASTTLPAEKKEKLSNFYQSDNPGLRSSGKDEWADSYQPVSPASKNSQKLSDFYQSIGSLSLSPAASATPPAEKKEKLSNFYQSDNPGLRSSGKDEWADSYQPVSPASKNSQKLSDFYQSIGSLSLSPAASATPPAEKKEKLSNFYQSDNPGLRSSGKDEWADDPQPSANNNSQKLSDFYQSIGPLSLSPAAPVLPPAKKAEKLSDFYRSDGPPPRFVTNAGSAPSQDLRSRGKTEGGWSYLSGGEIPVLPSRSKLKSTSRNVPSDSLPIQQSPAAEPLRPVLKPTPKNVKPVASAINEIASVQLRPTPKPSAKNQADARSATEMRPRPISMNVTQLGAKPLANIKSLQDYIEEGRNYLNGKGVPKNIVEGVNRFRKAAEQGHRDAQYLLGICYFQYQEIKNESESTFWFRKAAGQGHTEAQYQLGNRYYHGSGVTKNNIQAVAWIRKAAEQDHLEAQFLLGNFYSPLFTDDEVQKNENEAILWWKKAAEKGHFWAPFSIGQTYYLSRKDTNEAMRWYQIAADRGNNTAREKLQEIYRARNPAPPPQPISMKPTAKPAAAKPAAPKSNVNIAQIMAMQAAHRRHRHPNNPRHHHRPFPISPVIADSGSASGYTAPAVDIPSSGGSGESAVSYAPTANPTVRSSGEMGNNILPASFSPVVNNTSGVNSYADSRTQGDRENNSYSGFSGGSDSDYRPSGSLEIAHQSSVSYSLPEAAPPAPPINVTDQSFIWAPTPPSVDSTGKVFSAIPAL